MFQSLLTKQKGLKERTCTNKAPKVANESSSWSEPTQILSAA
jgi:hypothetical protein